MIINHSISSMKIKNFIFLLCFVFLGFNLAYPFSFFVALYILCDLLNLKENKFNIGNLLVFIFSLFFYASVYLFFKENTTLDLYTQITYFFMCSLGSLLFFISTNQDERNIKMVVAPIFMFFVFLRVLIAVAYSYHVGNGVYGYGLILDPVRGYETNSPSYSNLLAISASYFIFSLFIDSLSKNIKILYILTLVISLPVAVFLGGRTFFIAISISCILGVINTTHKTKIIFLILSLFFIFYIWNYFFSDNEYLQFMVDRFLSVGFESNRFAHYEDAITKISNHPFGGFSVDQNIEQTSWFHNLWFDVAKISGFLSLGPLLIINFIILTTNRNVDGNKVFFLMSFICLLVLSQDVIMEGSILVFLIYIFFGCGGFYRKL